MQNYSRLIVWIQINNVDRLNVNYYKVPTNHLLELLRIDVHAAFHLVRVPGDIDVLLSDQNVVDFMFPPHPWVWGILCQVVNPCNELQVIRGELYKKERYSTRKN